MIDASTGDVTIDLSLVTFLDSSGLAAVLAAAQRLRRCARRLTLVNPCEAVNRVLRIGGVDRILDVPRAAPVAD